MIPRLSTNGVLPPGIHDATVEEVYSRFATNDGRRKLFAGFLMGISILKRFGCRTLYLNGSFVTDKETPNDFDALWDFDGVNLEGLFQEYPVFKDLGNDRAAQKQMFKGEFLPAKFVVGGTGQTFLEFFQVQRGTGWPKGLIKLNIEDWDGKIT